MQGINAYMKRSDLDGASENFTTRLRSRLPMNVWFTFTGEQLEALRQAFGARFQRRHSLDVRGRLYLPWSRYYIVLQLGRDERTDQQRSPTERGRTVAHSVFFLLVLSAGLAGLGWLVAYLL